MSRLLRFCRCLTVVGCWQLAVVTVAIAQPTLLTERKSVPRFSAGFNKTFELPGHRFVHCGDVEVRVQAISGKYELALLVSMAVGDTVRYRHLNVNPANAGSSGDHFTDAVLGPDYTLTFLSRCPIPPANPTQGYDDNGYALTNVDTLGAVRWRRVYPLYPVGPVLFASALLRVPDGYLVLTNPTNTLVSTPTAVYSDGGLSKFDRLGNLLWQRTWPSRGYGGVGYLSGLVPRPDGSYLATGYVDNGTPYTSGAARPRFDHWLVQFNPAGDTIRTSRFGIGTQFESGLYVYNTSDGGAVVSGVRALTATANNDAQLVKVDSLFRPQWTYTQPNMSNYSEYFPFVQPLRRGDVVFGGGRLIATTREIYGSLTRFTPAGTPRWTWQHHFGNNLQNVTGYFSLISQPDSSAYLAGGTSPSYSSTANEVAFAHVGNVGAPYFADLCRTPPRASFGYAPVPTGDSLRFVPLSSPGPRYAQLALWHWDFGDGSSYDGPTPPPHSYPGSPAASIGVRLTVTNNLGCTSTAVVFPFAQATATVRALVAQATLFPNPTAGAATLEVPGLRPQAPVPVEVLNALGQVVQVQAVAVRQGTLRAVLDLSGLPPGVYAVRLRAQEGTIVKRMVRE